MARGQKKSLEEQIRTVDQQIAKVQARLDALKKDREEILKVKAENEMKELYQLMQASGLSVEELEKMIQQRNPEPGMI
ncbi:hypothetical protein [Lachnotalea sp. AF33-28]|jgi:50S ribosomal subunit-associated GTPase HflX|uniref:hypothetical protein n=1 Tax=Lachnotalea sp. AF33-28 TaxID=2292046 RepID=UPI000E47C637|nr:hypothetical protein [Lachnotalea sp. AF33-28]RHP34427.1 hypothetical protein DWZ56_07155 [Lachnotalea sp. AF33-28]